MKDNKRLLLGFVMFLTITTARSAETVTGGTAQVAGGFSALNILLIITFSGFFGGFVDGLLNRRSYFLRFQKINVDIGSLGDALVGATASVAIFTIAEAVFNLELGNSENLIRIVAWGVLSGYAGIRLLNPLSEGMVKRIASTAARDEVEKSAAYNDDVIQILSDANKRLTRYDLNYGRFSMQHDEQDQAASSGNAIRLLEEVKASFDAALEIEPFNNEALRGEARVWRRWADRTSNPTEKAGYWTKAMHLLDGIIQRDNKAASAYYTRACYKALSGNLTQAIKDLETAIDLRPAFKARAVADSDLENIKNDAKAGLKFREITGQSAEVKEAQQTY